MPTQTHSLSPTLASGRRPWVTGVLYGLAVALIWSGWSVATRLAVTTSLRPYDVTFLRFAVSALFLWPVLARNRLDIARIGISRLLVMVLGAGVPFMLLASSGMRFAPASHVATLMIGAMPIWVAVLSGLLFGERFTRRQLGGMAAVVAGVLCIGGYALLANRAAGEWRGDLLFLLAGLCFAAFTIAQRRSGISPWQATALVNVSSAVLFTPIYFLWLEPNLFSASPGELALQVLAQGVFVAILGMYCYAQAVQRLGAPRAAMFGALAPAFAVMIGMLFLREFPAWTTLAGIGLVMAGVALVVAGGRVRAAGLAGTSKPEAGKIRNTV
ncbi:DMT family transporter [Achromobacter deleyi]|uniref:DMT family transporter n=1 Tax=Achromobacter deleyi TaxID=1353891 RepID=UPI0014918710|nr:DMT family transporter [Achromobacter deleyi]QVQ27100.1 DMT family transporter [Achromobacter deleyi]UIP22687.1 DMT family transporter [Achromobacter deleyi]